MTLTIKVLVSFRKDIMIFMMRMATGITIKIEATIELGHTIIRGNGSETTTTILGVVVVITTIVVVFSVVIIL